MRPAAACQQNLLLRHKQKTHANQGVGLKLLSQTPPLDQAPQQLNKGRRLLAFLLNTAGEFHRHTLYSVPGMDYSPAI